MKAAVLERPAAAGQIDPDRLRDVALVRIACAEAGLGKSEIAADLMPLVAHRLAAGRWRAMSEGAIAALLTERLVVTEGARVRATEAGLTAAGSILGLKGQQQFPRAWRQVWEVRLVARALGLQREAGKRLRELATPEGLRAAIVQGAFALKVKGVPTPSRLRAALAAVALQRAFGNQVSAGLGGKAALPAKAGRLLAAQLAHKPRNFGTDARLIAALATEQVDAPDTDLESLRLAVLRRFMETADAPVESSPKPAAKRPRAVPATPRLGSNGTHAARPARAPHSPPVAHLPPADAVEAAEPIEARPPLIAPSAPPLPGGRPDLAGFVAEVRRHAASRAHGWAGDRKAYISHVWRAVQEQRPDWQLSEIEFKCMLAEAHRAGQLALANADLKDASSMRELQESAVPYRNAVFHFVRVEG